MKIVELMKVLNPIHENKYTRQKNRIIRFGYHMEVWMTGEREDIQSQLRWLNKDKSDAYWRTVGDISVNEGGHVVSITLDPRLPYDLIEEVKELVPDIEIKFVKQRDWE